MNHKNAIERVLNEVATETCPRTPGRLARCVYCENDLDRTLGEDDEFHSQTCAWQLAHKLIAEKWDRQEFDLEAFRVKVEERIVNFDSSGPRMVETINFLWWVLDQLPPAPEPPSPEEAVEWALLIHVGDKTERTTFAKAAIAGLRASGWLRDEQQGDGE